MVLWVRASWLVVAVLGVAACDAGGTPAAGGAADSPAAASSSDVPAPEIACEPYPGLQGDPLAGRSSFVRADGVDTLVIAAGSRLCNGAGDAPMPVSLAYITFGPGGTVAARSGQHHFIASYDGSQPLRIPFPILASPCLGAAVYLGDGDIGDDQLPATPFTGVQDGPLMHVTMIGSPLGTTGATQGLLAVDAVSGEECSGALRPAK